MASVSQDPQNESIDLLASQISVTKQAELISDKGEARRQIIGWLNQLYFTQLETSFPLQLQKLLVVSMVLEGNNLRSFGATLSNGVGIIDPSYRGELLVSMFWLSAHSRLPLPARVAQLIIKQRTFLGTLRLEQGLWEEHRHRYVTERGEGGFGSTDAKPETQEKQEEHE